LEPVVDVPSQQHVVEPFFERLLVDVGVAPVDRLLEAPVRRERRAFGFLPRLRRGDPRGRRCLCHLLQMWMAWPSTAIAASMTASLSVGCGWMLRPSSHASPWNSWVSAGSAMSSVALGPTTCAPISEPLLASATIFTKPAVSPWMIARPSAVKG